MTTRIEAYVMIAAAAIGAWAVAMLINHVMGPVLTIIDMLKV